jgi:DNA-binding transcriptional regulator YiaG
MAISMAKRDAGAPLVQLDQERTIALRRFADLVDSKLIDISDDVTFGKIVQHAVTYHGLSSAELADAFGVNKGTVSRWSAGKNAPQPFARPVVIVWIRDWMRSEADKLEGVVS